VKKKTDAENRRKESEERRKGEKKKKGGRNGVGISGKLGMWQEWYQALSK